MQFAFPFSIPPFICLFSSFLSLSILRIFDMAVSHCSATSLSILRWQCILTSSSFPSHQTSQNITKHQTHSHTQSIQKTLTKWKRPSVFTLSESLVAGEKFIPFVQLWNLLKSRAFYIVSRAWEHINSYILCSLETLQWKIPFEVPNAMQPLSKISRFTLFPLFRMLIRKRSQFIQPSTEDTPSHFLTIHRNIFKTMTTHFQAANNVFILNAFQFTQWFSSPLLRSRHL